MFSRFVQWAFGYLFKVSYHIGLENYTWGLLNQDKKLEVLKDGYSFGLYRRLSRELIGSKASEALEEFDGLDSDEKQLVIGTDNYYVVNGSSKRELVKALWSALSEEQQLELSGLLFNKALHAGWEDIAGQIWDKVTESKN